MPLSAFAVRALVRLAGGERLSAERSDALAHALLDEPARLRATRESVLARHRTREGVLAVDGVLR
jgi:hypothetical protein